MIQTEDKNISRANVAYCDVPTRAGTVNSSLSAARAGILLGLAASTLWGVSAAVAAGVFDAIPSPRFAQWRATTELAVAAVPAFFLLSEALSPIQIAGGLLVLVAVATIQRPATAVPRHLHVEA